MKLIGRDTVAAPQQVNADSAAATSVVVGMFPHPELVAWQAGWSTRRCCWRGRSDESAAARGQIGARLLTGALHGRGCSGALPRRGDDGVRP
jgi:hypothetical protein